MKKVRLFVNRDMTVIDLGEDTFRNFHSYDRDEVIAKVVKVEYKKTTFHDGDSIEEYKIYTDYRNPYRSVCSCFSLNAENFAKVQWIE